MDINKFIDFMGIFWNLYSEHREVMEEGRNEKKHFDDILLFVKSGGLNSFEMEIDDCAISNDSISFVFGFDFNDANESNNQSTTSNYHIVYDRVLEEFTVCDYEQG